MNPLALTVNAAYLAAWILWVIAGLALSIVDIRERRIPNVILLPVTIAITACLFVSALEAGAWVSFLRGALCGLIVFLLLLVFHEASSGAIGAGDVKLGFPFGMITGFSNWRDPMVGMAATAVIGGLISAGILIFKRETSVPYGPCMVLGAIFTLAV